MARPAQYDRDKILDKAMQTFWEHGYCATSMATLVQTTDLKPGSLYAAFESKQGLFLATLPIAYGGLISVGIAYTLQVVAQRYAHPAHAAIILSLEAVFAAFGGWLILGEKISWGFAGALALVCVGIVLVNRKRKAKVAAVKPG